MTITTLIDAPDTVEVIRDQVAAILAIETVAQQALAVEAEQDPEPWRLRVYAERSNVWENLPTNTDDRSPVVNVFWDTSAFEKSASNIVERQKSTATINVDCYGYGVSTGLPDGGHAPGDRQAAETAQRAVRLVRNILMAAQYTYLGLPRGTVWRRWVESITVFQPQQDSQNVQHIVGARLALTVEFNEYSPQVEPVTLELLTVSLQRAEDGQIVVEAGYDYTT